MARLRSRPVPSVAVPLAPLDLAIPHRLHVVGVGGPGMSAVAIALAEMGHRVSGSDLRDHPVLERVRAARVDVHVGHDRALVHGVDAVTASTAIPERNIELDEARRTGVRVLTRAGMLSSICAQADSIAVAGTHGKTTTTSMLMLVLAGAGLRPSFIVGGDVTDVGTGAQWTSGRWLVVEADESDGTHLELPLHGTILTNVEIDHLDHYGSFDGIIDSFDRYLAPDPGSEGGVRRRRCVRGARRPPRCRSPMGSRRHAMSVPSMSWRRRVHSPSRSSDGVRRERTTGSARSHSRCGACTTSPTPRGSWPWRWNSASRSTTSLLRSADSVVSPVDSTCGGATATPRSSTTTRTCRPRSTPCSPPPATSGDGWQRVIGVFQPNRYNRIAEMWHEYAHAFVNADVVVLTDIYPSGTVPIPGVTGKLIVNAVTEAHPELRVVWLPRARRSRHVPVRRGASR